MQQHNDTPDNLLVQDRGKDTNFWPFLQTFPDVLPKAPAMVQAVTLRFSIWAYTLVLVKNIAATGGAYYAN